LSSTIEAAADLVELETPRLELITLNLKEPSCPIFKLLDLAAKLQHSISITAFLFQNNKSYKFPLPSHSTNKTIMYFNQVMNFQRTHYCKSNKGEVFANKIKRKGKTMQKASNFELE
jgi:hypothetical protein